MEVIEGPVSIRKIFLCRQAWLRFWALNVLLLRWAIVWNVAKMLLCRNGWGHADYECLTCGTTRRVPHTCKSRFCSSCGKAAVDRWVESTLSEILDVSYKHLVFTIPAQFRDWLRLNRKAGLDAFFRAVKDCLLEYADQRGYRPGLISVMHTFGARLNWNVHIHVIITCGGLSTSQESWVVTHYIPQQVIRPMFRYAFLKEMKALFRAGQLRPPPRWRAIRDYAAFNSWLTQFYKKEWYVHLGKTLEEAKHTVRYVGRYGKRPVLAESRIEAFDGERVTFSYKDRATDEEASLTLPVLEFVGRIIQHIPDENFRTVRHAGLFATRVRTEALATARRVLKQTALPKPLRIPWRSLIERTFHYDPLICKRCGDTMVLVAVEFVKTADLRQRVEARHLELVKQYGQKKAKAPDESTPTSPLPLPCPPSASAVTGPSP